MPYLYSSYHLHNIRHFEIMQTVYVTNLSMNTNERDILHIQLMYYPVCVHSLVKSGYFFCMVR